MGLARIMERGGDEYHEYKKALKVAKKAIKKLCELTAEMEEEYEIDERKHHDDEDDDDYEYEERRPRKVKRRR